MAMFCLPVCRYTKNNNNIKTSFSIVRFLYLVLVQRSGVLTIFSLVFNGKELDCVVHFFVSGISLRVSGERDRRKN